MIPAHSTRKDTALMKDAFLDKGQPRDQSAQANFSGVKRRVKE